MRTIFFQKYKHIDANPFVFRKIEMYLKVSLKVKSKV